MHEWLIFSGASALGGLALWAGKRWITNAERQWERLDQAHEAIAVHDARLEALEEWCRKQHGE